jgi:mannose-1-phosphate guanylyltransferase/mannose-6-phosphate isomerase
MICYDMRLFFCDTRNIVMSKPNSVCVRKPWGNFVQYALNEHCTVKILICDPGQKLSLQRHRYRDELWIALDNGVIVDLDGCTFTLDQGAEIWLPASSVHRLSCSSSALTSVRVLEISFGNFNEDDIERLEDIYERV